jgi:hypothetical protein
MKRYDRLYEYEEAFYVVVVWKNFDYYVIDSQQLFAYDDVT